MEGRQIGFKHLPFTRSIRLSDERNPGCLGYLGDDTAQLCGDF